MGTYWAGFCSGSCLTMCAWLILITAHTQIHVQSTITCASCPSPVRLHLEELQPDTGARTAAGPIQGSGALKQVLLEYEPLGEYKPNTGVLNDRLQAGIFQDEVRSTDDGGTSKVAREDSTGSSERGDHYRGDYNTGSYSLRQPEAGDAALRRLKRSGPGFSESPRTGVVRESSDEMRSPGPLLDGHRPGRSEFKWNRDEGRGTPGDDLKLPSTTFALTGDSAHNHAVVYWSGQNSSVSGFIRTLNGVCF
ncbi:hypothetical protein DPEC_G00174060 [Dallia pectoralis]|uniref:Uncharacterized protein n=1 Tax=Dallia pectoralis TaxID=75939 RepID=A0ACC2GE43_DALPE|nr:hypothetical protein DPEC_G00174060 [Dallia pectoralis]